MKQLSLRIKFVKQLSKLATCKACLWRNSLSESPLGRAGAWEDRSRARSFSASSFQASSPLALAPLELTRVKGFYLAQCIDSNVSESQIPPKTVNLMFWWVKVNNKLTILRICWLSKSIQSIHSVRKVSRLQLGRKLEPNPQILRIPQGTWRLIEDANHSDLLSPIWWDRAWSSWSET